MLKEADHADNPPIPSLLTEAVELTQCPKSEGSFCCKNVATVVHNSPYFYRKKARRIHRIEIWRSILITIVPD